MKKILSLLLVSLLFVNTNYAQEKAFKSGEWFKFRIHYGVFTASYATLQLKATDYEGKSVYHVNGKGKSTGLLSLFFKVNDNYQSYFDKETGQPYHFIRKINEGGYTKNVEIKFDHDEKKALVHDKKHKTKTTHEIVPNVQDMISSFYYLRDIVNPEQLVIGEEIEMPMFFDKENYGFKLKFLGREQVKTKFGKVNCLKFRPYVQSGRVFQAQESVTVWVSDDKNKMPVRLQADLAVGSLKADIDGYTGLKHPLNLE